MFNPVKRLIVEYNNNIVGYLEEKENGDITFSYSKKWIEDGFSISPISLPLKEGEFISDSPYFDGLFGVFQDSLPEGWGGLLVSKFLRSKGINEKELSPLTKLSLISKKGLGGLTYIPSHIITTNDTKYSLDYLSQEIEKVLDDRDDSVDYDSLFKVGGFSCGARPKVDIKTKDGYWMVKFPCREDPKDMGKREYIANLLAKESGIDVAEFDLFKSQQCSGFFGTKRFDRKDGKRVHMVSLSSLLETIHRIPNLDYANLFEVIEKISKNKEADKIEAFKRMCFNVIYKNRDDHGKNFAFIYDEKIKGYKLSPFYDITKTPEKEYHEMTIFNLEHPTSKQLLEIGKNLNIDEKQCIKIINTIILESRKENEYFQNIEEERSL